MMSRPFSTNEDKFKVYTRTGDSGTSYLFNMERRPKSQMYFTALGDTDEVNAHVGLALAESHQSLRSYRDVQTEEAKEGVRRLSHMIPELETIQSRLLDAGSSIATPPSSSDEKRLKRVLFPAEAVDQLEGWIDSMDQSLPPLKNFILPGAGDRLTAQLHVCRTVCRRGERAVVVLMEHTDVDEAVLKYMNRLSDYFFVASRYANFGENTESVYKKS